jgi:hypothetical protein
MDLMAPAHPMGGQWGVININIIIITAVVIIINNRMMMLASSLASNPC